MWFDRDVQIQELKLTLGIMQVDNKARFQSACMCVIGLMVTDLNS